MGEGCYQQFCKVKRMDVRLAALCGHVRMQQACDDVEPRINAVLGAFTVLHQYSSAIDNLIVKLLAVGNYMHAHQASSALAYGFNFFDVLCTTLLDDQPRGEKSVLRF